jgi:hypothetical protein
MIYQDGREALAFSPQERVEQIQAMDTRQMSYALTYLSGFAPAVFDAVLGFVTQEPADSILDVQWRAAFFGEGPRQGQPA